MLTFDRLANTLQTSLGQLVNSLPRPSGSNVVPDAADSEPPQPGIYTQLPPIEIIRCAADLYFRFCHHQPYSLFHEATFKNKIETGELPTHLVYAVLASTVRYSNDPFFQDKILAASTYAQQSWKAIAMPWNGIQSDAELSIVQTILMLAHIDFTGRSPIL